MKALVQPDGRVAQVVADGKTFPVHPSLRWIDCDDTVRPDWHTFDGAAFVPPPQPSQLDVWTREAVRLDAAIIGDARYREEEIAGQISDTARARMAALIEARRHHRAARPVE